MLSICYESTDVDRTNWLHVPSGSYGAPANSYNPMQSYYICIAFWQCGDIAFGQKASLEWTRKKSELNNAECTAFEQMQITIER